ncbi:MAG: hypothetical protein BWX84_01931 [Verrucomicrobia bacterium ADurb.Bin118]|nr:MAG: hypothetical protein BWX84_01931 [Verrucomicrobia bacterium ADurb.Bin118]
MDVSSHRPSTVEAGPTSPKFIVSDGVVFCPATSEAMIWKSINSPFSLSTILGWAEVMRKLRATPRPTFSTNTASENGTLGSITSVNGSSLKTSRSWKYRNRSRALGKTRTGPGSNRATDGTPPAV